MNKINDILKLIIPNCKNTKLNGHIYKTYIDKSFDEVEYESKYDSWMPHNDNDIENTVDTILDNTCKRTIEKYNILIETLEKELNNTELSNYNNIDIIEFIKEHADFSITINITNYILEYLFENYSNDITALSNALKQLYANRLKQISKLKAQKDKYDYNQYLKLKERFENKE